MNELGNRSNAMEFFISSFSPGTIRDVNVLPQTGPGPRALFIPD